MMIRIILCLMFVSTVAYTKGQMIDLHEVRRDFNKGVKDKTICEAHHKNLAKHSSTMTEQGYAAAYHIFMAKHTGNPIKKMSYFNGGKSKLDKLIKQDPKNIELRFIRLCIQYHAPSYLGYKDNIDDDKDFLVENLHTIKDSSVKQLLFNYLKGANIYNSNELALLSR